MKKSYRTSCKKSLAWLLALTLLAGLTAGCQKQPETGKTPVGTEGGAAQDPSGQQSPGQQSGDSENPGQASQGQASQGPAAMGRYRETEIDLPQELDDQCLVRFTRGVSGNLELYTIRQDASGGMEEAFAYEYRDGHWERLADWPGVRVLKERNLYLDYVEQGRDGNCYLGTIDEEAYRYHLLRLEADGSATELLEEVFKPKDGREYGLIPPKFEVLANGTILVYGNDQAELYTSSGTRQASFARDFSGSTDDDRGCCDGTEWLTVWEDKIVRYDLETGRMTESIAYDEVKGGRPDVELVGDGAGGIYLAGEAGLAHINRGGSLWEILIDGSLTHLGMRSLYLQGFLPGDQGEYYGVFTGEMGRGIRMFSYTYDPELAAVPPSTLTIYSLEDQSTVRQAASQFQSDHPEVRVEFRTAVEKGGTVTQEMIQSLNTELLSGKGADILLLDGLPAEAYVEKGVLLDLSSLVEELEGSGAVLNNLLEGFRRADGTICQIPARVAFPLLLGKKEAVQAYTSLETMAAYQGEHSPQTDGNSPEPGASEGMAPGQHPLQAGGNYENLLRRTALLQYPELFGNGSIFQRDGLIRYLEAVKAMGEANGSKTLFTSQEEMERMWTSNYVVKDGLVGTATHYDNHMCDSGLERLDGFWGLAIPAQVRVQNPGSQMVPVGKIYLPIAMAGINRSTASEDLAKEFLRCLLSVEVQKEYLYDGFPVNREGLQALVDEDKTGASIGSGVGDYSISAQWPEREVRMEVAAMLEELTIPALVDETVMEMIVEGATDYLDGKQTSDQAADGILRKMSVYLAE